MPTENFAWGGTLIDTLLTILPIGIAANIIPYLMIAVGFLIISRKNSFDLATQGTLGWLKVASMTVLFSIAMYSTLHATSSVFLYFNF